MYALHDVAGRSARPCGAAPARPSRWRRSAPAGRRCSGRGCAPGTRRASSSARISASRMRPPSTSFTLSSSTPSSSTVRRERRHGAGRDAADVGVVAARADVEEDRRRPVVVEDGRDDGDVGQVRAAVVRVVQHVHVARLHRPGVLADHGLDRLAHRAQVHGHVRRVGDQVALGVEQRAGEVEPLLDVHRVRGCARRTPICSAIDMKRLLKTSSITGSAVRAERVARLRAARRAPAPGGRARVTRASQPGSTTVVALRSAMIAGPGDRCAGGEPVAVVDRRAVRGAAA